MLSEVRDMRASNAFIEVRGFARGKKLIKKNICITILMTENIFYLEINRITEEIDSI